MVVAWGDLRRSRDLPTSLHDDFECRGVEGQKIDVADTISDGQIQVDQNLRYVRKRRYHSLDRGIVSLISGV